MKILCSSHYRVHILIIDVLSVGGKFPITAIRKTVMFNIAEMASVIFSPDSLGIKNTNREMRLMHMVGRT